MKPHIEEAQRSLRFATRDLKAFNVLKDASDIDRQNPGWDQQTCNELSTRWFG
jgi:hypothetical protein